MEWRDIPDWPAYQICSAGEVRKKDGGKILKQQTTNNTRMVRLVRKNKEQTRSIHRLLLETFKGPQPAGRQASHVDGNRLNNKLSNLAWSTPKEIAARRVKSPVFLKAMKEQKKRRAALRKERALRPL